MTTPANKAPAPPPQKFFVTQLNGVRVEVLDQSEVDYHTNLAGEYNRQYETKDASDLADIDRLLMAELQAYRLGAWLMSGLTWDGYTITSQDAMRHSRSLKDLHVMISGLKNDLGMTKAQRERSANAGSVASYIMDLRSRAKEFGVHREKQLDRALEMMMRLKSIVETYDRSNQREREIMGFNTDKDIVQFVRDVVIPLYDEVDAHFRANVQRYWRDDQT